MTVVDSFSDCYDVRLREAGVAELQIYGQFRLFWDWLFVEDHARALVKVATRGVIGETYNIGGHNEK